ncbi:hypothetical protein B0H14DRAFT_2575430 [Mycena olivaceomarginata]|nr:hypothetical protein B0H14DRAFT_2575430 [Mycena olivaceomarginata]
MFKLLVILPFVASLAGTTVAAPIGGDVSLLAQKSRNKAAAAPAATTQATASGNLVACTNIDQSAAAFSGDGPDLNLQDHCIVAIVTSGFPDDVSDTDTLEHESTGEQ